jgi:predicted component of type VI protein secretion system
MPTPITLKVFRGDELVRSEQFNREIIKIGRLSSAHLCLEDERVSRIHAVIEVGADGKISIIDMGSAEGTYVNGKRINKGPLKLGDEITLGGLRIQLEGPAAEAPAPAPAAIDPSEQPTVAGVNRDELLAQVDLDGLAHEAVWHAVANGVDVHERVVGNHAPQTDDAGDKRAPG